MGRVVALLNQKGGVGKTTVTLGLASAAAAAGHDVLIVDLDPQASSTWVLGGVPPSSRAFFSASVEPAASYRVQVLSFEWTQTQMP